MGKYIRLFVIFLLLLCIVASCDGNGNNNVTTRTIGPEGGAITSSDGKLTLEIPAGALTEDTEITITKLNPEDLPPELDGSDPNCLYDLSPDGLQLLLPATVSIRLNEKPLQEDGSITSPNVLLVTSNNGVIEVLDNIQIDIDGDADTLIASGETMHFSPETTFTIQGSVRIDGIREPDFTFEFPFAIDIDIKFSDNVRPLTDPIWSDFSKGLLPSGPELPLPEIKIPAFGSNRHFLKLDYSCSTLPLNVAQHGFSGKAVLFVAIEDPTSILDGMQVGISHNFIKTVNCIDLDLVPPLLPPPPPTEPPVVPTLEAIDIDGRWNFDCSVFSEFFLLIVPNLGDPFSFQADLIVNPETLELIILTDEEIFELKGFLMPLENGDFSFNGDGLGFLGDTNPAAAEIILKAEDWDFSLNVPGPFSGDNQPGDVFVEGVLRFNFPTFPLKGQSSIANCVGNKTGD